MMASALRSACARSVLAAEYSGEVLRLRADAHRALVRARNTRSTIALDVSASLGWRRSYRVRIDWPLLPGEAVSTAWGLA